MFRLIGINYMKIIGITGGIGSGKSTVASLLAELGAIIIDADKIGYEVLDTDNQARKQVVAAFGQGILNPNGSVNRKEIGKIVFTDRKALLHLNQIMHPLINRIVKTKLMDFKKQKVSIVVLDAPLLIEANWINMVDTIWVITTSEANVFRRLEKIGFPDADIAARISCQLPESEQVKMADIVINNNFGLEELRFKVNLLWQELQFDSLKS
jgi:dephospho-CoA kinase